MLIDSGILGGGAQLRCESGLLGGGAIPFLQKIDSDLRSDEGLHGFANISSEGTILIHQCSVVGLSIVSTGLSGVVVLHRDGYSDDLCPALIG